MKRMLLAGGIVALVLLLLFTVNISYTQSITIRKSYVKVLAEMHNMKAWRNWWPDSGGTISVVGDTVLHTPSITYVLKEQQPLSIGVAESNSPSYHVVTVIPSATDTLTTVSWKKFCRIKTAITDRLQIFSGNQAYTIDYLLQCLKTHIEDPLQYYGFNIRVEPVTDTFILVRRTACVKPALQHCLKAAFALLQQQLDAAGYRGKCEKMFHIDSSQRDSVRLMAGISIDRTIDVKAPFEMMKMPRAHIVVGYHEGSYRDIQRLHQAITRYMHDYRISMVAVPYEKLLSDPLTARDSLQVKAKVYYPPYIP